MRFASPRTIFWACRTAHSASAATRKGKEQHGATLAGAKAAETIHADLQHLKDGIQKADETLAKAEEKGMEVSEPKFNLHKASDALTNARTQIHSFKVDVVEKALADGEKVVTDVQGKADHALEEYQYRRYLAGDLVGSDPDRHRAAVALYPRLADSRETGRFRRPVGSLPLDRFRVRKALLDPAFELVPVDGGQLRTVGP